MGDDQVGRLEGLLQGIRDDVADVRTHLTDVETRVRRIERGAYLALGAIATIGTAGGGGQALVKMLGI